MGTEPVQGEYTKKKTMTGVFGDEHIEVAEQPAKKIQTGRSFDFRQVRYWPWVDIICIFITCAVGLYVIINFEAVTSKLFWMFVSLMTDMMGLLIIVGLILCLYLWLRRRRRYRW